MNREEIEEYALELLRDTAIAAPPVDLGPVLVACDAIVKIDPRMPADLDGVVVAGWTRHLVRVNGTHRPTRRRFTIAHELGHLNLHCSDGGGCLLSRRGTYYEQTPEREANLFAAYLLMPAAWMRADIEAGIRDPSRLASRYNVSPQAVRVHLRDLYADDAKSALAF